MSEAYKAVLWNRDKKLYDAVLAVGVVGYIGTFLAVGALTHPQATIETLLIRALGTAALLLLHIILSIGPLARLDRRFLPLLYNRRHMGVTMFILALAHGAFAIVQFHALGVENPVVSVLTSNGSASSISQFPFQPLGLGALAILFLMAATSHDFWLKNLTAPTWKALHMSVYLAYVLLIGHVVLGVLQDEGHPILTAALVLGVIWVCALHLIAAWRDPIAQRLLVAGTNGRTSNGSATDGKVRVCRVSDIEMDRARIVELSGERVAVFRYRDQEGDRVAAVSNVCQHQNGPLGEGQVIDGCITCPWHGYQYRPEDGASPPPFTETIPTFQVAVLQDEVWVDPQPLPPGTRVEPALLPKEQAE